MKKINKILLHLTSIIDLLPGYVYWTDKDGVYQGYNHLFAKIAGLPSKPNGVSIHESGINLNAVVANNKEVIAAAEVQQFEENIVLPDGRQLMFLSYKIPLQNRGTDKQGLLNVSFDITDIKNKEKNLLAKKEQIEITLDSVIAHMPGHVYWKDRNGVYLGCNDRQAHSLGMRSGQEVIGKTDFDLSWSDESAELFRQNDLEVIRTGISKTVEEIATINGSKSVMLSQKVPLKDSQGNIVGILGISTDITKQKKIEKQLELAKERAEMANSAKSEFLAVMSHELRTPLNAILGMAQILRLGNLGTEEHEYAETIFQAGNNLLLLIDDVLAISKIEAGKLTIISEPFDLRDLIDEIMGIFAHQAREENVELIIDYPPSVSNAFIGDARRIRQVLVNLIGNAVKFTHQGHVLVTVEANKAASAEEHEQLLVKVIDTGIGIPEDKLDYVFERFTQINSSYSRPYQGTGLGLSIAKRLVEMMGGKIGVESKLKAGSTFWLSLPLPQQQTTLGASPWEPYQTSTRVLIVDDNKIRGEVLAKRVAPYTNNLAKGAQALDTLLEMHRTGEPYHITVIDQKISSTDALSLGDAIKANSELGPMMVILLTEVGRELSKQIMSSHGFFSQINKPVSPVGFLQALSKEWKRWLSESYPETIRNMSAKSRVLLIEDNALNQQVAKLMLEKMNCEVDTAETGAMALKKLEKQSYNLIFMDIGLPDMDGLTVTAEIRRREDKGRRIPIIAITAHVFEKDIEQCFAAGMDDVITKPLLRNQLLLLLRRWAPWGRD